MNINQGTFYPLEAAERKTKMTNNLMERFMWVTKLLERVIPWARRNTNGC